MQTYNSKLIDLKVYGGNNRSVLGDVESEVRYGVRWFGHIFVLPYLLIAPSDHFRYFYCTYFVR